MLRHACLLLLRLLLMLHCSQSSDHAADRRWPWQAWMHASLSAALPPLPPHLQGEPLRRQCGAPGILKGGSTPQCSEATPGLVAPRRRGGGERASGPAGTVLRPAPGSLPAHCSLPLLSRGRAHAVEVSTPCTDVPPPDVQCTEGRGVPRRSVQSSIVATSADCRWSGVWTMASARLCSGVESDASHA
jgi:hypothetical protein